MSKKSKEKSKQFKGVSAEALRSAGYVPLPRWWVLPDELEVIHRMAHNHREEVNRIRGNALRNAGLVGERNEEH